MIRRQIWKMTIRSPNARPLSSARSMRTRVEIARSPRQCVSYVVNAYGVPPDSLRREVECTAITIVGKRSVAGRIKVRKAYLNKRNYRTLLAAYTYRQIPTPLHHTESSVIAPPRHSMPLHVSPLDIHHCLRIVGCSSSGNIVSRSRS